MPIKIINMYEKRSVILRFFRLFSPFQNFAIIVIDILTEICEKVVVPNRVFRLSDANV
jgi:hypothetical protein